MLQSLVVLDLLQYNSGFLKKMWDHSKRALFGSMKNTIHAGEKEFLPRQAVRLKILLVLMWRGVEHHFQMINCKRCFLKLVGIFHPRDLTLHTFY